MDASIILPTYNEVENLNLIVPRISGVLEREGISFEVLVMDDNSPDGTAEAARNLSAKYPVRVHVRTKERGLATAVMKGFEISNGTVALVMDADLSHPVEKLPDMLRPILEGNCDATVGSRYIKGGDSDNWPFIRKVVSKGAGLLARGVTSMSDPTSGFMAIRRSILKGVELDPVGWKIVLEVLVKTDPALVEVPIVFTDRCKGESKLSLKTQLEYLRHLGRLYSFRYSSLYQFFKFCLVGLSGTIVDTLILISMVELTGLDPRFAAIFGFLGAVSSNYVFNRRWTFRGENANASVIAYLTFFAVCVAGLAIRLGIMHTLMVYTALARGRGYVIVSLLGILAATAFNYTGSKFLVFKNRRSDQCLLP